MPKETDKPVVDVELDPDALVDAGGNSTFASRAAGGSRVKRVGTARNKAITAEESKAK